MKFIDSTVDGPQTNRWILEAADCAELKLHRISKVGLDDCAEPYERVRASPDGSFIMACTAGMGQLFLDGRWQSVEEGTVCMAPPRVPNAFRAISGHLWRLAWIRFEEPTYTRPLVSAESPVRIEEGAASLERVLIGLREEWEGCRDTKVVHHWLEIIRALTSRLTKPWKGNDRPQRLWEHVETDLGAEWTLIRLGKEAHASQEHLRRLCQRELGRSPMEQVTYMRMCRARTLLETTDDKLEVIAGLVGYEQASAFTLAFKRWVGVSPAQYRQANR